MGSFVISSIVSYELCQYRRRLEKQGMLRAAEIVERKKALKEQKMAERRAKAAQAVAEAEAAAAAKKSSWW